MKKEFCIMPPNNLYSTTRDNIHTARHETFFGVRNRQKSIDDGLVVFLTPEMHNASNKGVHFNRSFDLYLKKIAEQTWLDHYNKTIEDFIKRYGRNYL